MKKFEVVAQSNDAVLKTIKARDLWDACVMIGEEMEIENMPTPYTPSSTSVTFEDANDYYWLREAE